MRGEVRHFGTLRCRTHFWLMWCKNYRNRSRFPTVITEVYCNIFMDHSLYTYYMCLCV